MSKASDFMHNFTVSRRDLLRYSLYGAAGLVLPDWLGVRAWAEGEQQTRASNAKAKSVIQLWMWGGPSHLDTFDPKPAAGYDYVGPFTNPVATNVSGIQINELLTELAKIADKYSLIRSMTHGNNGHETAAYLVQTGNKAEDGLVHPGSGAIVSFLKGYGHGYNGLIPPYIVLTELLGRFSEAGFLGEKAQPLATGGDPSATRFVVEGVVAENITDDRQRQRRELMHKLNTFRTALPNDAQLASFDQSEDAAYDLILGDAGKVFDLTQEPDDVRLKYGKNKFGQSCLLARRLVERGVPYIAINHGGWDTHKQNFPTMKRKLPELDKAMSALISDLHDRGLLDSTIVWCGGEFGRTPKVQWEEPWNGGRGHWGQCFSALVAGGGFKGGHVVGSSDPKGELVNERPVYPSDLLGSMYDLLGIDPATTLMTPQGNPVPITVADWDTAKTGGRLKEIV